MFLEVESNPNCEQSLFLRFKEVGPPRGVIKVRTFDRRPEGEWCWVTGWSDDEKSPVCPAYAQQAEDSGAGLTTLVYGGICGIRLKPVSIEEEWSLESRNQWGEPYLSLADTKDIVYEDTAEGREA